MAEKADEPEIEVEDGVGPISAAAAMAIGVRKGRSPSAKPDPKLDAFLDEQTRLVRLQTEHLHEQRELQLAHLRVRRWKDRMSLALQGLGVLAGAAVLAGLGVTAWQAHEDDSLVVEPFATPPALAQQGLTGAALGGEMVDRISTIDGVVKGNSITDASAVKADSSEDIKLEIPETGVSVGEIGRFLRDWLGRQRKVEGDLRQTADGKLQLTARLGGRAFSASGAPAEIDQLEQKVAEQIFGASDPSNYVIYLDSSGRKLEAAATAQGLAAVGTPHAIALWATEEHELDPAHGVQLARLAVQVAPHSPYSYFELTRAEDLFGRDEAALAAARRLRTSMATDRLPQLRGSGGEYVLGLADRTIALNLGDYAAAVAAKWGNDPVPPPRPSILDWISLHDLAQERRRIETALISPSPNQMQIARARAGVAAELQDWRASAAWAAAALDLSRKQHAADPDPKGLASFAEVDALEHGPILAEAQAHLGDFAGARAALSGTPGDCYACTRERGRIAMLERNWPEAERWFAEAARQGPSLPFAYLDWAQMLLAKGDPDAALVKLRLAHEKGPKFADVLETWGEMLMAQRRFEGAARSFAEADKHAPAWGRNHLIWGEALMLSGRYAEARRQYEIAAGLDLSRPDRAALDVLLARTARGPLHG
jgi:tetratricopeptide (TPR) repeat protein